MNTPLLINSFKILPVNCFINCIDIDYKEATSNNNCDYERIINMLYLLMFSTDKIATLIYAIIRWNI